MSIREQTRLLRWLSEAEHYLSEIRNNLRRSPNDEELRWAKHEVAVCIAQTRARLRAALPLAA